ncbi:MAG: class I SAM-dependent methyltransferase [Pseudomonadota bacterium]
MDEAARREFLRMVRAHQERGDPSGWCDQVYRDVDGDFTAVFWADLVPNPYLVSWLETHPLSADNTPRAITIGCGVGDDAEALSAQGYQVTAFDISPAAIDLCHKRYPNSRVEYVVADLFDHPKNWVHGFDLVFECNTIQVLPDVYRLRALNTIAAMVAPGGVALVSCRSRNSGEMEDAFPLPLDRPEINGFVRAGLREDSFVAYDDDQNPPVPHFFACYRRT